MTDLITPSHIPAGATPEGDGIITGDGPVRVDAFIDFLCPFCRRFELSAGPALADLIAGGLISLAQHPMNFLDDASTTSYSTRAAAASGCAADQGRFTDYAHALFLSQPPEGGPGLPDAALVGIGRELGLPDAAFASCVAEAPYLDWPSFVTARATALGVEATPTVLVAGTAVQPDARAITAAVREAAQLSLSAGISVGKQTVQLMPTGDPELREGPVQVGGHGPGRQEQALRDLAVGQAGGGEPDDLLLLWGELAQAGRAGQVRWHHDPAPRGVGRLRSRSSGAVAAPGYPRRDPAGKRRRAAKIKLTAPPSRRRTAKASTSREALSIHCASSMSTTAPLAGAASSSSSAALVSSMSGESARSPSTRLAVVSGQGLLSFTLRT